MLATFGYPDFQVRWVEDQDKLQKRFYVTEQENPRIVKRMLCN